MKNPEGHRRATHLCAALLCGALAGCGQDGHSTKTALVTCDPPTVGDYLATWRFTLPSTLTGSTFTRCTDSASEGTAVIVPTETPCPEDPTSPCPVVINIPVSIYLIEYHPGGEPRFGFRGTNDAGLFVFGEVDHATCTASFSLGQDGGVGFGCSGTIADNHRELFGSCSRGSTPIEGQSQRSTCDVSPPIEPLVEFLTD